MNKPSQLRITTPTPDFCCCVKTAPSTFTLKIEATGGDQTYLHCGFAEPNAEVGDVATFAEVVAFAEFVATFAEFAELGKFVEKSVC